MGVNQAKKGESQSSYSTTSERENRRRGVSGGRVPAAMTRMRDFISHNRKTLHSFKGRVTGLAY